MQEQRGMAVCIMGSPSNRLNKDVVDIINQLTDSEWATLEQEVEKLIVEGAFDGTELQVSVYVFMKYVLDQGRFVRLEVEEEVHNMVSLNPPTNNRH